MLDRRRTVLVCALGLLVPACSGERGEDFESQTLTRVSEGKADECENGALHIETGVDTNKNGVLDDDEVDATETRTLCQGEMLAQGGQIRRTDMIPEGDTRCPDGGVVISTGTDQNGNDKLDDAEITATDVVCNSERPHAVLTKATTLPVGDPDCRYGGRRVDAGLDDGAGEGKPDDNVLSEQEVDSSYLDCNTTPPAPVDVVTPPEGAAGKALIDLRGGAATGGLQAGNGGSLSNTVREGLQCTPATTRFFATGKVDASFKVPTLATNLGNEPLVVSTDLVLELVPEVPVIGSYYYQTNDVTGALDPAIVHWTGAGAVRITGLRVQEGAKLTVPANAIIQVESDVEILGTLLVAANEANSLSVRGAIVVTGAKGSIELAGLGTGNPVDVFAFSTLSLQGSLLARGVQTGVGGAAVTLSARGRVYLGGTIDVSGADSDGTGGAGGQLRVAAGIGGVWSSATVDATGGTGKVVGGAGGLVFYGTDADEPGARVGDVRNTGKIDASGGTQTVCPLDTTCAGGLGGRIALSAVAAPLASSGELRASGGDSEQTAGNGGSIELNVLDTFNSQPSDLALSVTGSLIATGGEGATARGRAGNGGNLRFQNCGSAGSSADFFGYGAIELGGGNASDDSGAYAGSGGTLSLSTVVSSEPPRRLYLYTPVHALGGDGYGGGNGGGLRVDLSLALDGRGLPSELPSVVLGGDLLLEGGKSGDQGGGYPGSAALTSHGSVEVSGKLSVSASSTTGDDFPPGGNIDITSTSGAVVVTGTLAADGSSNGKYDGGAGGCVSVQGRSVELAGMLSARGGNGAPDNASSIGGDGGQLSYTSHDAPASLTGTLNVSGGEGSALKGHDGQALPDLPACGKR